MCIHSYWAVFFFGHLRLFTLITFPAPEKVPLISKTRCSDSPAVTTTKSRREQELTYLDCLAYLQPLGLLLDIIGFWLVIKYGHALFIRTGTNATPPSEMDDGALYITTEGGADVDIAYYRRKRRADVGVALVIIGFTAQFIAAAASLV